MKSLLLVPLEDVVVFPNMNLTLTVDVGDAEQVLLVPRHEGEFAKVGTVADVVSSASTAQLPRRFWSFEAMTGASRSSSAPSRSRARSPTPRATRPTSASRRRSSCSRPST